VVPVRVKAEKRPKSFKSSEFVKRSPTKAPIVVKPPTVRG